MLASILMEGDYQHGPLMKWMTDVNKIYIFMQATRFLKGTM